MEPSRLKVGCCGFPLKKPEYAAEFPVVEVQQTFYQPPQKIETLINWREMVPEGFEFTLKAWQIITHTSKSPTYRRLKTKWTEEELEQGGNFQNTPIVKQAWEKTLACARALKARYVLFQCPASFLPEKQNLEHLRTFFCSIDRAELTLLWEPRGSWAPELILSLCQELNLVHVVDPFLSQTVTPELTYYRLHGGKGFKHVFTDAELNYLAALMPRDRASYLMFNNIQMLNDARRFLKIERTDDKAEA